MEDASRSKPLFQTEYGADPKLSAFEPTASRHPREDPRPRRIELTASAPSFCTGDFRPSPNSSALVGVSAGERRTRKGPPGISQNGTRKISVNRQPCRQRALESNAEFQAILNKRLAVQCLSPPRCSRPSVPVELGSLQKPPNRASSQHCRVPAGFSNPRLGKLTLHRRRQRRLKTTRR